MRDRDWGRAAELYGRALEREPDRAEIWVQRGHALKEGLNLDGAERAYRRAVLLAPHDADAALHLGHLVLRREARLAALVALRRASALGDEAASAVADTIEGDLHRGDLAPWPGADGEPGLLRVAGRVVSVAGAAATGWALDVSDPLRPVRLALTNAEGERIAEGETAPDPEADHPSAAGSFAIPMPEAFLDGASHPFFVTTVDGARLAADVSVFRLATGGAVFADAARGAIAGWTESGLDVAIRFDDGPASVVAVETALAGLATPSARGFRAAVPPEVLDGQDHVADVRLSATGAPVPGSPLTFSMRAPEPKVAIHAWVGRHVAGALSDADGAPLAARLGISYDDGPVAEIRTGAPRVEGFAPRARADFAFDAPGPARYATLHALDGPEPAALRTLALDEAPGRGPSDAPGDEGPAERLDPGENRAVFDLWLDRVDMEEEDRSALAEDAAAAERFARACALPEVAPLVSIIMPTHNRAHTLAEAIESVLDQRYQRWELLIGDDASTDRSAQVAKSYGDPRIRYLAFEKSNGAATRNKALRFARGSVIAYLDSDNVWSPWFLSVTVRRLALGWPSVCSGYVDVAISGSRVQLDAIRRPEFHQVRMHERNSIDLNAYAHHRALYDWLGGFDETLPRLQDWDLFLRHGAVFPPSASPLALTLYRRNPAWGQVTQLFAARDVRRHVMEKTAARVETGHPRLALAMPRAAEIVVLAEDSPGARRIADALSRLFGPAARVETHVRPADGAAADGGPPARLWRDPEALGRALAGFRPCDGTISVGFDAGFALALERGGGRPAYALRHDETGFRLVRPAKEEAAWSVGAPDLGDAGSTAVQHDFTAQRDGRALLLTGAYDPAPDLDGIAAAIGADIEIALVPPDPFGADWSRIRRGTSTERLPPETALADARRSAPAFAAPSGLTRLHPASAALCLELMGCGAVPALPLTGYWEPLFQMRAGHRLRSPSLEGAAGELATLCAERRLPSLALRARRAHAITWHPELGQERLRGLAAFLVTGHAA